MAIQRYHELDTNHRRGLYYYTIFGIAFGALFPLLAWVFECWYYDLPCLLDSLRYIHDRNRLLYMIDSAPVFLGIFAYIAGRYRASTNEYALQLKLLVQDLENQVWQRTCELEAANASLQQSALQASASAQAQGAFLANMSHEIRTPMNAIIGMATIAKKNIDDPSQVAKVASSIDQIVVSSRHLLGLINNILDLSKIEAGEFALSYETFLLPEMLAECSQIIMPRCMEKEITLDLRTSEVDNLWVSSDKLRLMQVLINLMGNAIKFTPQGGTVTLEVRLEKQEQGSVQLWFAVKDTGIGMAPETLAILFQPFKQGTGADVRRAGGTGLGLAISQNIVSTLGGKIEAASTLGEGSCFFFSLKMQIADLVQVPVEEVVPATFCLDGKRILLVEDVEANRIIVQELLGDLGIILDMAVDGHLGVEAFAVSSPYYYDMILMDVQMPTMDGYAATRAIRSLDRPDALTVPIVAMTANAMKEDALRAKQNGMNDHVAKPIDYQALIATLEKYLGH